MDRLDPWGKTLHREFHPLDRCDVVGDEGKVSVAAGGGQLRGRKVTVNILAARGEKVLATQDLVRGH